MTTLNKKAQIDLTKKVEQELVDLTAMEVDAARDELSTEEVLKGLLNEWRHLDKRFIP